jgi:hypothetical protein
MTAGQVTKLKRAAFAKEPAYRQRINDVRISRTGAGFVVQFRKHSGANLAAVVEARLTLEDAGKKLLIVEETDSLTDERLRKPMPRSCSESAFEVATELVTIQEDIRRVARELPDVHPGGVTYEEGPRKLSAAMGYFHPQRFESRWLLDVEGGMLTVTEPLTMRKLTVTPEQTERVRRACSGAIIGATK